MKSYSAASSAKKRSAFGAPALGVALAFALLLGGATMAFGAEISVNGYVKFDAILDLDSDLSQGQLGGDIFTQAPPLDGTAAEARDGGLKMHARQSRLIFQSKGESNGWPVRTYIEADFLNGGEELQNSDPEFPTDAGTAPLLSNTVLSNSREFRLRHAYFTYGPFLFGQVWSNFMGNLSWAMETGDFKNQSGIPFIRQAQFRFTMPFSGGLFAVAAENPTTFIVHNNSASAAGVPVISTTGDSTPDITAHVNFNGKWGNVGIVALARTLRAVGPGGTYDETANASAFGAAGRIMLGARTNVRFGVWSGQLGRYGLDNVVGRIIGGTPTDVSETATILGDAYITPTGSLETVDSDMTIVSLQWWFSDTARINVGIGIHSTDVPSASEIPLTALIPFTEEITTTRVSYFWNVSKPVQYGIEWINKEVTAHQGAFVDADGNPVFPIDFTTGGPNPLLAGQSDDTGSASRLQFSARYKF